MTQNERGHTAAAILVLLTALASAVLTILAF